MNVSVQPRHIKPWPASQSGEWTYDDYERHAVGGSFARIVAAMPGYNGVSDVSLVAAFVTLRLAVRDGAVKARDRAAFVRTYGALTNGCNRCHQAAGQQFVIITQPDAAGFPDRTFKTKGEQGP